MKGMIFTCSLVVLMIGGIFASNNVEDGPIYETIEYNKIIEEKYQIIQGGLNYGGSSQFVFVFEDRSSVVVSFDEYNLYKVGDLYTYHVDNIIDEIDTEQHLKTKR